MRKTFKTLMNISVILSLLFVGFGIVLFTKPDTANKVLGYAIGILILLMSISSIIKYIFNKKKFKLFQFEMIYGILSFVLGLLIIFNPLSISSFLTLGLGLWLLVSGLVKSQNSLILKKFNEEYWLLIMTVGIINVIFGGILIFDPLDNSRRITEFIGLFTIAYGILNIVETMLFKKNIETITKIINKR